MASRGANGCMKMFLMVVNLLFLLMGIVILGVGIYLCTNANLSKYSEVIAGMNSLRSLRFILVGCGCFVTLIGMCGCVGACKENRCLLVLYLILLFLVLFINLAAVILSVVYNSDVKTFFGEQIKDRLKRFYGNTTDSDSKVFTRGIDKIQSEELCCGWTGRAGKQNIFISTPWHQQSSSNPARFPDSCCSVGVLENPEKKEQCVRPTDEEAARDKGYIHADDCLDKLIALNSRFMHAVLGTVILAILLQILCIICSVVITRQISAGDSAGRAV